MFENETVKSVLPTVFVTAITIGAIELYYRVQEKKFRRMLDESRQKMTEDEIDLNDRIRNLGQ